MWADSRVVQEVHASSPEEAIKLASQYPGDFERCSDGPENYRLLQEVMDINSGEYSRVGGTAHCKTCGSEIVETVNGSNFGDGECGPCEYERYQAEPELFSALNALYWSKALHDSEVPEELWEKVLAAVHKGEK